MRGAPRSSTSCPATCRCSGPRATHSSRPGCATPRPGCPTTTRYRRRRPGLTPMAPTADLLLELFHDAFAAQRRALATLSPAQRRARTDRSGQYALDVVADAAVLDVLARRGRRRRERGVGPQRSARRRDHRGRRSGRRLDELRARDPVLGDLTVRDGRRRPVVRARGERRDGGAHRSRRAAAARGSTGRGSRPRRPPGAPTA